MAKITTHPAIITAQAVYDLPGDLNADQQVFLAAVHRITMDCAMRRGVAVQMHGLGSPAYLAVVDADERKQADDLAEALDLYEQTLAEEDEILEIELVTAEAAE